MVGIYSDVLVIVFILNSCYTELYVILLGNVSVCILCSYHNMYVLCHCAGVSVTTSAQKLLHCKLCIVACSVDLVAKAPLLNMIQFNGLYGCPKCLQKGITERSMWGWFSVSIATHDFLCN